MPKELLDGWDQEVYDVIYKYVQGDLTVAECIAKVRLTIYQQLVRDAAIELESVTRFAAK